MITQENKVKIIVNSSRLETPVQGSLDFPCAGYYTTGTEADTVEIPWHYHPEFEIIMVLQGEKEVHLPGTTYAIQAGECLFINSNVLHYALTRPHCVFRSLVFSPSLVYGGDTSVFRKKYIDPLIRQNLPGFLINGQTEWETLFQQQLSRAFSALEKEPYGYEFTAREALSACCLLCYRELHNSYEDQPRNTLTDEVRLRQMLDYIRLHYTEPVTLQDIAQAAHIGIRECLRCFRQTIGIPPMQYLKKYRIGISADLLVLHPQATVASIASECGFDSPSYYAMTFRRFYHLTPQEYRFRS